MLVFKFAILFITSNPVIFLILDKNSILKDLPRQGAAPKSEFRIAYEEAISHSATVYLGDRPIHVSKKKGSCLCYFSQIKVTAFYRKKNTSFFFCIALSFKKNSIATGVIF